MKINNPHLLKCKVKSLILFLLSINIKDNQRIFRVLLYSDANMYIQEIKE